MGGSHVGGDCGNVCPILFVEDGFVEDVVHLLEDKHLKLRFTRLAEVQCRSCHCVASELRILCADNTGADSGVCCG